MKYKNIRKVIAVSMAIAGVTLAGCQGNHYKHSEVHNYRQSERQTRKVFTADTPSEKLAKTVLTSEVIDKLGGNNKIRFNGAGAFIINDNKTDLNANVSSSPYASNEIDALKRPTVANALLNKTTRQYGTREQTHNGVKNWNWKPAGFKQVTHLSGKYNHAYDRGHLLAYALIGNLKGYDASESNP